MDIKQAKKHISAKLSACIVTLEQEELGRFHWFAADLFEMIGFVRGRSKDQRSATCRVLFEMREAAVAQDLSELWRIQRVWSKHMCGRMPLV